MLSMALSIVFWPVSSKTNALAGRTVSETAEKLTHLHSSPFSQAWTHQINVPSSSRMINPKIEIMAVAAVSNTSMVQVQRHGHVHYRAKKQVVDDLCSAHVQPLNR